MLTVLMSVRGTRTQTIVFSNNDVSVHEDIDTGRAHADKLGKSMSPTVVPGFLHCQEFVLPSMLPRLIEHVKEILVLYKMSS